MGNTMSSVPSRRVSDEDRDRVAGILSDHLAAGRLDPDEFADRVGLALSAGTSAELGSSLADLPWRSTVDAGHASARIQPTSDRSRAAMWLVGGGALSLAAGFGAIVATANYWMPLAYLLMVLATVTAVITGKQWSGVRSVNPDSQSER